MLRSRMTTGGWGSGAFFFFFFFFFSKKPFLVSFGRKVKKEIY